mgnify:CR=1 FL=1
MSTHGAGNGTNPAVQAMLMPGTYQAFIGSYMAGPHLPDNPAITESPTYMAAQVPAPTGVVPGAVPTPGVAVPTGGAPTMATG